MGNPAETYESYMVPVLFAPSAECLLAVARPRPGERVLDVGCGTGIVARRAARLVGAGGYVMGLDPSSDMLAVARAAADRDGVSVEWRQGRAEALPFPDGQFDLVSSQYALMFFAGPAVALSEMRRVLADRGRAVLSVWQKLDRHPFYEALDRAIERELGASSVRQIFALGDTVALHESVARAGFSRVEVEAFSLVARFPDPDAFLAGEIDVDTAAIPAMQHLDTVARKDLTARIQTEMAGALRSVIVDGHVELPFHAYTVRANR